MAHNRTTQYSAPFRRNNLLGLHQYIASEHFTSLGNWDRSSADDLYVVKGTSGRCHPVYMTIVAAISSDKAHLQAHRNYDPTYTTIDQMPKKTRLQFVLTSPADDPDFAADYSLAIKRLKAIQEDVAASEGPRQHFIDRDNLKMNFLLFEPKENIEEDPDEDDGSHDCNSECGCEDGKIQRKSEKKPSTAYEVESQYRAQWDIISQTHDNKIMEVYGLDELPVSYNDFAKVLAPGTTVAVNFLLKHYAIRAKGSRNPESDTYSAFMQSVSILKNAEKIVKSKTTPKRRPVPVTQLPSRGTLKLAANTFAPVRQETSSAASSHRQSVRFDSTRNVAPPASSVPLPQFVEGSSSARMSNNPIDPAHLTFLTRDDILRLIPVMLDRINDTTSGLEFYDNPTRPPTPMNTNISVAVNPGVVPGSATGPTSLQECAYAPDTTINNIPDAPKSDPVRGNDHEIDVGNPGDADDSNLPPLMPLSDSEGTLMEDDSAGEGQQQQETDFLVVQAPKPSTMLPKRKRTRTRRA